MIPNPQNLRRVMPPMPCIIVERHPEADRFTGLRVKETAIILLAGHRLQELTSLRVQTIQQSQCRFNIALSAIAKLHPVTFFVGFDCRTIFGERPLKANDTVQMTVGDVVRDLPYRPVPVESVELQIR